MYGYFYPEDNERCFAGVSFDSVAEAVAWWRDRRSHWQELAVLSIYADKAAFIHPRTREIVVVRVVEQAAQDE